jgi:hypothetical protein
MRGALVTAVLVAGLVAGAAPGFFVWLLDDRASKERARADTLERVLNADIGTGDAVDDGAWLDGFLRRNAD